MKYPNAVYTWGTPVGEFNIFRQLIKNGFLKNTRNLVISVNQKEWPHKVIQPICSMKKLEKLVLFDCHPKLEEIAHLFQSCRKLIEFRLHQFHCDQGKINNNFKKRLRSGFQRLRIFELHCSVHPNSWLAILEIFT
jgi:hypothetical protein